MKTKTLIAILLIMVAASLTYWLLWPSWGKLRSTNREIKQKQDEIKSLETEIGGMEEILSSLDDPDVERIKAVVPVGNQLLSLILEAEALIQRSGMVVKKITVAEQSESRTQTKIPVSASKDDGDLVPKRSNTRQSPASIVVPASPAKNDYQQATVEFTVTGNLETLKNFLKISEGELRLMDVQSFDYVVVRTGEVASAGASSVDIGDFNIKAKVYYIAEK